VDRREIIAVIDAEIERLRHARLLIVQSAGERPSNGGYKTRARPTNVGENLSSTRDRQPIKRSHVMRPILIKDEPQVVVTRIPPKEPPKRRAIRAATKPTKQWTALTGDVPQGPVVVAAKNPEIAAQPDNRTPAATSAFGLAIRRSLASVGT
jgi:hypothetical protein